MTMTITSMNSTQNMMNTMNIERNIYLEFFFEAHVYQIPILIEDFEKKKNISKRA